MSKKLSPYNKPKINVVIGIIVSAAQGCIYPTFGVLISKALFALMLQNMDDLYSQANKWALYMLFGCIISLITSFC
jgi:hypothetical protein